MDMGGGGGGEVLVYIWACVGFSTGTRSYRACMIHVVA